MADRDGDTDLTSEWAGVLGAKTDRCVCTLTDGTPAARGTDTVRELGLHEDAKKLLLLADLIACTDEADDERINALCDERDTIMAKFRKADAALSAHKAAGDGWRPIAEAPKDGRRVLAGWPHDGHVETVRWAGGEWVGDVSGFWQPKDQPKHWQPLPSPPTQDISNRKETT